MYTGAHGGATDANFYFDYDETAVISEFQTEVEQSGSSVTREVTPDGWERPENGNSSVLFATSYRSVVSGVESQLVATDNGGTAFRRMATDRERDILKRTDFTTVTDDSTVVVGDDLGGFVVADRADDTVTEASVTPRNGSLDTAHVTQSLDSILSTDSLSVSFRRTDHEDTWYNHPYSGVCSGCAGSLGSCAACAPTCAGSVTGVGAVACAACLFIICRAVLYATCLACADCFTDHPP